MTFIDNIDWLQIAFDSSYRTVIPEIRIVKKDGATPMYQCIEEVILQIGSSEDGVIGVLLSEPRKDMKFLGERYHSFQFKNRVLYTDNGNEKFYITILKWLQKALNFTNYHIVRLDICRDFEKFKYGLLPETFIKNFINDKYYLEGKKGRVKKEVNFKKMYYEGAIIMNEVNGKNRLNTLTIGNRTNSIMRQLYNKTIEQQREEKPYITELHDTINPDREKREIWRLEFRLQGSQLTVIDNYIETIDVVTGEIDCIEPRLKLEDIAEQSNITTMLNFLIESKFSFRITENTQNKARDWDRLELFDKNVLENKLPLKRIEVKSTSTRQHKIYIKANMLTPDSMRSYPTLQQEAIREFGLKAWLDYKKIEEIKNKHFAQEHNIENYVKEKVLPYTGNNFVRNEKYKRKRN